MKKILFLGGISLAVCVYDVAAQGPLLRAEEAGGAVFAAPSAEWTVAVYINARNNLAPFAPINLEQMMAVSKTSAVNVVVQWGSSQWRNHVYRFGVTPGMALPGPSGPTAGVVDIGDTDMGDIAALESFLKWVRANHPAKRLMLVVWDHGSGYRLEMVQPETFSETPLLSIRINGLVPLLFKDNLTKPVPEKRDRPENWLSTYRAISSDSFSGHHLYNRQIQDLLEQQPVDVIGFDACLMSMVETAYAMRRGASVMVGSEELEPGLGWAYNEWLRGLVANPTMDPETLGNLVVKAYQTTYATSEPTGTLSCTRLIGLEQLATDISALADALQKGLSDDAIAGQIHTARLACSTYAPGEMAPNYSGGATPSRFQRFSYVDIAAFCTQLATAKSAPVRESAMKVLVTLRKSVASNWAGSQRVGPTWWSQGLSIYFPLSGAIYANDLRSSEFGNGYERGNTFFPVEFVERTTWTEFLHSYVRKFPTDY